MNISISNLHLDYLVSQKSDIWDAQYSFSDNSSYQIRAASGKGKSSFVNLLFGIYKNYTGEVFLNQKNIKSFTLNDWSLIRKNQMSIVFQDLKLFEDKTALQNLLIKNELTQYYDQQTIESFATTLQVSHTLNRPIQTLSYGERQRIAIIRAMLQPFEVLLLDEPFSHLDKANIHRCVQLIEQEVKRRNATIIHCDLEPEPSFSNAQILSL